MGIELELALLLIIHLVGSSTFAKFEIETPAIRKITKWLLIDAATVGLYYWIGHWAMLLPVFMVTLGTIVHFRICRKNGIDPLKATPREELYKMRGWKLD
jgi:hypothetical protein